jgi:D-alanyl-D-alanine carboxypeptidase (penicillin-binding protein 5/6)
VLRYARPSSVSAALAIVASCLGPVASSNDSAAATGRAVSGVTVLTPRRVVPGPRLTFHWPSTGEAAVAVAGVGVVGASPNERKVAVASLTKMMTALVVLHDHPLGVGQPGPSVAISPSDVRDWHEDVRVGNSSVEVKAGETLTEYQLLEALLIPSGDNIADRLAIWDAGSTGAFVQEMNLTARAFGLRSTSYVDPSGVDPGSASSAADQAFVASKLMADPVAARIVRLQRINLPVVGILANRNPALAVDGILGVKGGYSLHARSCLVTAAYRVHQAALVISVALGQADPTHAARIDEALLEKTTQRLRRYHLAAPSAEVATLTGPPGAPSIALVGPAASPTAVVWPGLALGYAFSPRTARALRSPRPGSLVGVLTVSTAWGALRSIPVRVATAPGRPR